MRNLRSLDGFMIDDPLARFAPPSASAMTKTTKTKMTTARAVLVM